MANVTISIQARQPNIIAEVAYGTIPVSAYDFYQQRLMKKQVAKDSIMTLNKLDRETLQQIETDAKTNRILDDLPLGHDLFDGFFDCQDLYHDFVAYMHQGGDHLIVIFQWDPATHDDLPVFLNQVKNQGYFQCCISDLVEQYGAMIVKRHHDDLLNEFAKTMLALQTPYYFNGSECYQRCQNFCQGTIDLTQQTDLSQLVLEVDQLPGIATQGEVLRRMTYKGRELEKNHASIMDAGINGVDWSYGFECLNEVLDQVI